MADTLEGSIIRGQNSWAYFYILLGFLVSIEATLISMLDPMAWYLKIVLFVAVMLGTSWLCLESRRFQNWVIGVKNRYESRAR